MKKIKNKVIEFNKENLEKLPINSLYWDYRDSEDVVIVKVVASDFHSTSQRLVGSFYKSTSPISL